MKVRNLLLIALIFFALTSCDNSPTYNLIVNPKTVHIPKMGGSAYISIEANAPWEATSNDNWIITSTDNSEASLATLEIKVESENGTSDTKEGLVTITNGDKTQSVIVLQYNTIISESILFGKWRMSDCASVGMIGSEFTFNDNGTCIAKIQMIGNRELNARYELVGNIITISVPTGQDSDPMKIEIIIESVNTEGNSIETIAMGYDATIEKVV